MMKIICLLLLIVVFPAAAGAAQLGRITSEVNFRKGPDRSAPAIGRLAAGAEVEVIKLDPSGWYFITYRGRPGFVHKNYIALDQYQNSDQRSEPRRHQACNFGGNNPRRHWNHIDGVCVGSGSACNRVTANSGSRLGGGLRSPVSIGRALFLVLRFVWRIRTFPVFQKKEKEPKHSDRSDPVKESCMTINTESWAKSLRITFVCLCVLTIALAVAYALALFYIYSFAHDPKLWGNSISFYAQPKQGPAGRMALPSTALGSLVVRGNNGNPTYATRYELSLNDIKPSTLHDCLLAAEDKRFYRHTGMDYFSVAAAVLKHFIGGERLRGASTISNQLVGEVILADRSRNGLRAYLRKFEEIILTNVVERHFSKDDLLLAYINNVPVGHLDGRALIGLSAASEALFGKKDPKALTLSEACTLAGMLNRPNGYIAETLKGDYLGVAKRRNVVLDNLRVANPDRYSREAIDRAKTDQIRFFQHGKKSVLEPRQFISYAYERLPRKKAGLQIHLTLDPDLQRAAEAAVSKELKVFRRRTVRLLQPSFLRARRRRRPERKQRRCEASSGACRVGCKDRRGLGDGRREKPSRRIQSCSEGETRTRISH